MAREQGELRDGEGLGSCLAVALPAPLLRRVAGAAFCAIPYVSTTNKMAKTETISFVFISVYESHTITLLAVLSLFFHCYCHAREQDVSRGTKCSTVFYWGFCHAREQDSKPDYNFSFSVVIASRARQIITKSATAASPQHSLSRRRELNLSAPARRINPPP